MTDGDLLAAVLVARGLTDRERGAFRSMAAKHLETGRALTIEQRGWVSRTAARLGVFAKGRRPRSAWEIGEQRSAAGVQASARAAARGLPTRAKR